MYTIESVTANIDSNLGWIIVWTIIGWTTGGIQLAEGIRLTRRDGVLGAPIATVIFLLVHDSIFAMNYHFWFETVNHWYFSAYVFGMAASVPVEVYLLYFFLKNATFYNLSKPLITISVIFMVILTYLMLWGIQILMAGDPLHLATLACTCIFSVVFGIPMLVIRGNTKGQSRLFAWTTLLGPASFSLMLFPTLSDMFRNGIFFGIVICLFALAAIYIMMFEHYRRLETSSPAQTS